MLFNENDAQQLKKLNIHLSDLSFNDLTQGKYVGVSVELQLSDSVSGIENIKLGISNRRGHITFASDFIVKDTILSFNMFQRLPDTFQMPEIVPKMVVTSFIDLCWFAGNEAIPDTYDPNVGTSPKAEALKEDLGLYLSSRFLDNFIASMGTLNEVFFLGELENAQVYGPFYKEVN